MFTEIPLRDQQSWNAFLASLPHAFAHTWQYCHALSVHHQTDIFLLSYKDAHCRVACPLMVKTDPYGSLYVTTPYGYGGLVAQGDCRGFRAGWYDYARQRGFVCGYIGLNPALPLTFVALETERFIASETYVVNLTPSIETLFTHLSDNIHNKLKNWQQTGARLVDNKDRLTCAFIALYHNFIENIGAEDQYRFSATALRALLDSPDVSVIGSELNGEIVAASVFAATPSCAEYFLSASSPQGRSHSAALLWEGIKKYRGLGVPVLNLGGGISPGDGLARFKSRFHADKLERAALKQIYDATTFRDLCRKHQVPASDMRGFFPPYLR